MAKLSLEFRRRASERTNCYTWALGCAAMGWSIPGSLKRPTVRYHRDFNEISTMRALMQEDGLVEITSREAADPGIQAIALRISPQDDFHFYARNGQNGCWTHKMGDMRPSEHDDRERVIENPEAEGTSHRYKIFGGYYTIPPQGIYYFVREPDLAHVEI